jgi:hypothetical protein
MGNQKVTAILAQGLKKLRPSIKRVGNFLEVRQANEKRVHKIPMTQNARTRVTPGRFR